MKTIVTTLFASLFLAGFALAEGDDCKKCKKGDKHEEAVFAEGDDCKKCKKGENKEEEEEKKEIFAV